MFHITDDGEKKKKQECKGKRSKNKGPEKVKKCRLTVKTKKVCRVEAGEGDGREEGKPRAALNVC